MWSSIGLCFRGYSFLIYVNKLCNGEFAVKVRSFADDMALCYVQDSWTAIEISINNDVKY